MKNREIKFKFLFRNDLGAVVLSKPYDFEKLLVKSIDDIWEELEECNCQLIGETNTIECNCGDMYNDFSYSDKLQFTGLRDKNGVEIYEGDILLTSVKIKYVVEWDRDWACFKSETGVYKLNTYGYAFAEVIGNIYQNPELL